MHDSSRLPARRGGTNHNLAPTQEGSRWSPPANVPESGGIRVDRLLAAARRHRWLIAAVIAVGVASSIAAAHFVRPKYEVQSTVWISSLTPIGRSAGPIRAEELVNASAWPDLLRSYSILDAVVREADLYLSPADSIDAPVFSGFAIADTFRAGDYELRIAPDGRRFFLTDRSGRIVDQGAPGDSIGRAVGFRWRPDTASLRPGRTIAFSVASPRDAAVALRERLTVQLPRESNILRVSMLGTQPERDAATMNLLMERFIETAALLKRRNHGEYAATLREQLIFAEQQLREAEMALEGFRVGTITLPSEGGPMAGGVEATRDPVLASFFAQKIQYDDLVYTLGLLRRTMEGVRAGRLDPSALWSIPAVQSESPELRTSLSELASRAAALRAARATYTDLHPSVIEAKASVAVLRDSVIPQQVRALEAELANREATMSARIEAAGRDIRTIPARTIEEMRLRRNVEVRETLYTTLKNRFEEARLAEASDIPDVTVLDTAVAPLLPSEDTAPRLLGLGLGASLAAAMLLVFLLDRLDHRFRYPDQVVGGLGLEIIGAIPSMAPVRGTRRMEEQAAQATEAFRSVRLALQHALGGRRPIVLTITSPGSGDGKSLVAANLALSFAEAGLRTVLVDGDTRKGVQHSTFDVVRRPGLVEHLAGAAELVQVVRPTGHDRLWVMPSGARSRTSPELLTSSAMPQLIEALSNSFDVVIVDSAPLAAGIDAFAIGATTRNVVLVMRAGATDRRLASAKLELLDRLPVGVIGAILNDVRAQGEFRYYSYAYGGADVEDEPVAAGIPGDGDARITTVG